MKHIVYRLMLVVLLSMTFHLSAHNLTFKVKVADSKGILQAQRTYEFLNVSESSRSEEIESIFLGFIATSQKISAKEIISTDFDITSQDAGQIVCEVSLLISDINLLPEKLDESISLETVEIVDTVTKESTLIENVSPYFTIEKLKREYAIALRKKDLVGSVEDFVEKTKLVFTDNLLFIGSGSIPLSAVGSNVCQDGDELSRWFKERLSAEGPIKFEAVSRASGTSKTKAFIGFSLVTLCVTSSLYYLKKLKNYLKKLKTSQSHQKSSQ